MLITKTKTDYPVTLNDAKIQLRIGAEDTDDENYIEGLIENATIIAENYIEKDIAYTNNLYTQYNYSGDVITIHEGNFLSLVSITLADDSTVTEDYVETFYNHFRIYLNNSVTTNPIKVVYKSGYTSGNCPQDIQGAIKIKIVDLYNTERGSYTYSSTKDNQTFSRILDHHKIILL